MSDTEAKIIELLRSTGRDCIESLIDYLKADGFFEAPASTKFHGSYPGGLAMHSLRVYEILAAYNKAFDLGQANGLGQKPLPLLQENIIIAGLLHDVCKIGAYIGNKKPYKWNRGQPEGHALLSINRIKDHIELTEIEEMMIKFHMGVYGAVEWEAYCGEYSLRGDHSDDDIKTKEQSQKDRYGQSLRNAWYHNPICKLMYFCDEIATLEEKAKE